MLDKNTKDRIAIDARKYWMNTKGDQGELDYAAGATAEAERAQGLVNALETIIDLAIDAGSGPINATARAALTNHNNSK